MKVVQINAVYGVGSTGMIAESIHNTLLQSGHESYVFYASQSTVSNERVIQIGNKFDHKLHALLSKITGKQAYFSKVATLKLISKLKKIKPDTIHLHNIHSNYINFKMLCNFVKKNDIHLVITLHDCWFFTGKCTHFTNVGCSKWKDGCHTCPQLKKDNSSWFFDCTKRLWTDKSKCIADIDRVTVVGVSDWISDLARQSLLKDKKILTIHNGVDQDIFRPDIPDLRQEMGLANKFVLIAMANKWLDKSNENLLEFVLDKLSEDFHILLVGADGKSSSKITYLPFVKSPVELAKLYRTADVFVNVTHEDSLPTVNLEALSCGTPVITYADTGCLDTVNDSVGILVKENDRQALLDAVVKLKNDGKANYSDNARKFALENFNKNVQYKKYIDIYEV